MIVLQILAVTLAAAAAAAVERPGNRLTYGC